MKKADYVFTIGFDGDRAVVDKRACSQYGRFDTRTLSDKGLFQAAFRSAVFDNNEEDAKYVLEKINQCSTVKYGSVEELGRVFGLHFPPDDIRH